MARTKSTRLWDDRKRECIADAVIQLISRDGIRAVTMERVAQEVGIAKGTVYLHYRDKQHLLDAAKESALQPLMERVEELSKSKLSPIEQLEVFALRYVGYFDERRDFFRVLLYEREIGRGDRFRSDRYQKLLRIVTTIVEQGIAQGVFRDIPAPKAAAIFLESNIAMIHQRLLTGDRTPVEADVKLICSLFERGLVASAAQRRLA